MDRMNFAEIECFDVLCAAHAAEMAHDVHDADDWEEMNAIGSDFGIDRLRGFDA